MSTLPNITAEMLDGLRDALAKRISPKRFRHTLGVEREIERLGQLYLPAKILPLRAAALLHDVTKELSPQEQIALCEKYGIPITRVDRISPKTFHAKTACPVIKREFPEFATDEILDAVRKHTTGAAEMSVFAKLLYLADYIEDTRTFPDCITLRSLFWDGVKNTDGSEKALLDLLDKTLLISFDMTVTCLIRENAAISTETMEARNALVEKNTSI